MNLAVSSIAWAPEEDLAIAKSLQLLNINLVELAPTKIWEDPTSVKVEEIQKVVEWWDRYDIDVAAFQSMLFSRPDLKLFESRKNREETLDYLKKFVILAGEMGARRMVFGSPKNRQRGEMSYDEAFHIAVDFFRELAQVANENNVVFCIEPNAPQYNCDFITNANEGADLVKAVDHPGFGLHLDTAGMALAGDDISQSIYDHAALIQHFHISSPMLEQVEARSDVDHEAAAKALKDIKYDKTISIEMRPGAPGENVERTSKAVKFAQSVYVG